MIYKAPKSQKESG